LRHDPDFKKSILRKATANIELGNNPEAVKDLRKMLKLEPINKTVRLSMAKVSQHTQMSTNLAESFTGHYLRRITLEARLISDYEVLVSPCKLHRVMVSKTIFKVNNAQF
jgi:hypothetical protein